MQKKRIVLDTNIQISAFVFPGGIIQEIMLAVFDRKVEMAVSQPLLDECSRVLRKKLHWQEDKIRRTGNLIVSNATIVNPDRTLSIIRDEPDNRVLECAEKFRADCIISGDRHILAVGKHGKTAIMRASDFIRLT